jgi:AraC family transcriptional regulator
MRRSKSAYRVSRAQRGVIVMPQRHSLTVRAEQAKTLVAKVLEKSPISVTYLRHDAPGHGVTDPSKIRDSFLMCLGFWNFRFGTVWRNGRVIPTSFFKPGALAILDLQQDWLLDLQRPFCCMHFVLSQSGLDELVYEEAGRLAGGLRCPLDEPNDDAVALHLGQALLPALERPAESTKLFIDSVGKALAIHFARTYGALNLDARFVRGGLAPWQLRRVMEFISADLSGDFTLTDLARECDISAGHFSRAFKKSTAKTPHRWLMEYRIERAKDFLQSSTLPISEIAQLCGFADQSHLTRVFAQIVGMTPKAWRELKGKPEQRKCYNKNDV